jgi:hypothetical protein
LIAAKLADELPGTPWVLSADRDMFLYGLPRAAARVFAEFAFTAGAYTLSLLSST